MTTLPSLQSALDTARQAERQAMQTLCSDAKARGGRSSDAVFDAWVAAAQRVAALTAVAVTSGAETIESEGMTLHRAGADRLNVTYSTDGRPIVAEWHEGEGSDDLVYYERCSVATGCRVAHGWVDAVSRRIVQTG